MNVELTILLQRAQSGDVFAEREAYSRAYNQLKTIARALLGRERAGHTLQPTALIAETFIQKLRSINVAIRNRDHFYCLVAGAMRQVLIDHARMRGARKRLMPDDVVELLMRPSTCAELQLDLSRAMGELLRIDSRAAGDIHLRYVDGMTLQQVADRTGQEVWRVRANCAFGLKWLASKLESCRPKSGPR